MCQSTIFLFVHLLLILVSESFISSSDFIYKIPSSPANIWQRKLRAGRPAKLTQELWNPALPTNKFSYYLAIAVAAAPLTAILMRALTASLSPLQHTHTPLQAGMDRNRLTQPDNSCQNPISPPSSGPWWIVGGQPGWLVTDLGELLQCTTLRWIAPECQHRAFVLL